jgi:hypothetical protein
VTRLPSLDEAEALAWASDTNARFSSRLFRDNRHPSTKDGALGCLGLGWCGQPVYHDWPGKAAGAPHPRGDRA